LFLLSINFLLLNFASNTLNIILLFLRFYHDFSHQLPWGSPNYSQLSGYSPGQTVPVKYYLVTYSGDTNIGVSSIWKTMTIGGTAKINIGSSWKKAVPYVKVTGSWKPTVSYIKTESGSNWNRGQV